MRSIIQQIVERQATFLDAIAKGRGGRAASYLSQFAYPIVAKDNLGYVNMGAVDLTSGIDESNHAIRFTITTLGEDRDGDIVVPRGCQLKDYARNPVIFFGHQEAGDGRWVIPIATARFNNKLCVDVYDKEIKSWAYFDVADPDADFIYGKVKRGILNATSVAFVPIEAERRGQGNREYDYKAHSHHNPVQPPGWLFKVWSMTEYSVVGVPANAGAIRDSYDQDKSFLTPRMKKALQPYCATAMGCWNGWCPCPPCEQKAMKKGGYFSKSVRMDVKVSGDINDEGSWMVNDDGTTSHLSGSSAPLFTESLKAVKAKLEAAKAIEQKSYFSKSQDQLEEYLGFKLVRDNDSGLLLILGVDGRDTGKSGVTRAGWKQMVNRMASGRPPSSGPGAYDARGNRRKSNKMDKKSWMEELDAILLKTKGKDSSGFPGAPIDNLYEEGALPKQAAVAVVTFSRGGKPMKSIQKGIKVELVYGSAVGDKGKRYTCSILGKPDSVRYSPQPAWFKTQEEAVAQARKFSEDHGWAVSNVREQKSLQSKSYFDRSGSSHSGSTSMATKTVKAGYQVGVGDRVKIGYGPYAGNKGEVTTVIDAYKIKVKLEDGKEVEVRRGDYVATKSLQAKHSCSACSKTKPCGKCKKGLVTKGKKVIYLQGYKTNLKEGMSIKLNYLGEEVRGKILKITLNESKMRNASGSIIPMPQTMIELETKSLKKSLKKSPARGPGNFKIGQDVTLTDGVSFGGGDRFPAGHKGKVVNISGRGEMGSPIVEFMGKDGPVKVAVSPNKLKSLNESSGTAGGYTVPEERKGASLTAQAIRQLTGKTPSAGAVRYVNDNLANHPASAAKDREYVLELVDDVDNPDEEGGANPVVPVRRSLRTKGSFPYSVKLDGVTYHQTGKQGTDSRTGKASMEYSATVGSQEQRVWADQNGKITEKAYKTKGESDMATTKQRKGKTATSKTTKNVRRKAVEDEPMEEKDEMDTEEVHEPKHGAQVLANLHNHYKSAAEYLDGEMKKLDNPLAEKDLMKHRKGIDDHMEDTKSMLEKHYPDEDMDNLTKGMEVNEGDEMNGDTETGEDLAVSNGEIPESEVTDDIGEEDEGGEVEADMDEGETEEKDEDESGLDPDDTTDEILDRYKQAKGYRGWKLVKVQKAGKFKVGDKVEIDADETDSHGAYGTIVGETQPGHYKVRMEGGGVEPFQEGELKRKSYGRTKDLTNEGNPAELKSEHFETVRDAGQHMYDLSKAQDLPAHHKAGLIHHSDKMGEICRELESGMGEEEDKDLTNEGNPEELKDDMGDEVQMDLTDEGSMDGAGTEDTNEGNPAELKDIKDDAVHDKALDTEEDGTHDEEKDLTDEGNPAELKRKADLGNLSADQQANMTKVMEAVKRKPGLAPSDIQRATGLSESEVSYAMIRLQRQGKLVHEGYEVRPKSLKPARSVPKSVEQDFIKFKNRFAQLTGGKN